MQTLKLAVLACLGTLLSALRVLICFGIASVLYVLYSAYNAAYGAGFSIEPDNSWIFWVFCLVLIIAGLIGLDLVSDDNDKPRKRKQWHDDEDF